MINQENFSENDTTKDKRLAQKQKIRKEKAHVQSRQSFLELFSKIIDHN